MKPQPSTPWFIYTLSDPRFPDVVRYVGWTLNPQRRLKAHLTHARSGRDKTHCGNWKRAVIREGYTPVLTVIESGVGKHWGQAEARWVAHYRALLGRFLTNHTDGGEGFRSTHSKATRERMSAAQKGRPKPRTAEHAKKLRESIQARQWSDAERAEMRARNLGKKASPEHRAKISAGVKRALKNPELLAQRSETQKRISSTPEEKSTRSLRMKALWADPKRRADRIEALKAQASTSEARSRRSRATSAVHAKRAAK